MAEEKKNQSSTSKTESYVEVLRKKLAEKADAEKNKAQVSEVQNQVSEETREKIEKLSKEKVKEKKVKPAKPEKVKKVKQEKPVEVAPQSVVVEPDWKKDIKNDQRSTKTGGVVETTKSNKSGALLKRLGIIALSAILVVGLVVGGYFAYLQLSYSRILDMQYIQVDNNQAQTVIAGQTYTITTFNLGFGAYSSSFSFFMDEGEMASGEITKGKKARAFSKDDVVNNINGAVSLVKSKANSDFYFFQEVDTDSTRSYYVNQVEMLKNAFTGYASVFAENAHSSYMFYPLNEPIGTMNSGIMTLSRYGISYSVRRSFPVDTGMINKLFDLDRCFSVTKLPVYSAGGQTGKYLVLVNVHMSAYDEGNIRLEQLKMLYEFMDYEYNTNGNYVVVGGDFNLSLANESGIFNNEMKTPGWCQTLPAGYKADDWARIGYSLNYDISTTNGTCRDASIRYTEGINLEVVIDGFITSANVTVSSTETIDGDFKNSDHNPVKLQFTLN